MFARKQRTFCASASIATFLFDTAGAKRKVSKRETPRGEFRRLRTARRATRPPPAPTGVGATKCCRTSRCRFVQHILFFPTVRQHPVGRGFEEVYKRAGHKPKSVLHKRCAKTPLRRTKKGSTLFALPSEGSNPFCLGSFGGARGDFFKSPLEQSRVPQANPRRRAGQHAFCVCALSRVGRFPSFSRKVAQMQKKITKSIEIPP